MLLIAKKCFLDICASEVQSRLRDLGLNESRVIINDFSQEDLADPHTVPLINYGVIGINLFEQYDCAYCLTGYYINEEALSGVLQDLSASDFSIDIKLSMGGKPPRRTAAPLRSRDRFYDVSTFAQLALDDQEMGTVIQAVGRVRPFTKPREIITFQCAAPQGFSYSEEFTSISDARNYFSIPTERSSKQHKIITGIQNAREKELNQKQAAEQLGLGLRTVQRYWKPNPPPTLI